MTHEKGKKPGKSGLARPSTFAFRVQDPELGRTSYSSPPLRLFSLKEFFRKFRLLTSSDPAGFNYENFVNNLRGMKSGEINGSRFDVLFTMTSAFVFCEGGPENLRAISRASGDPLANTSLIGDPEGHTLTICRISGGSVVRLLSATALSPPPAAQPSTGMLQDETANEVDLPEFRRKLKSCSQIDKINGFDLHRFADGIELAAVFKDEEDKGFYVISIEGDPVVYNLYINSKPAEHFEENIIVCKMRFNGDTCVLVKTEVIS